MTALTTPIYADGFVPEGTPKEKADAGNMPGGQKRLMERELELAAMGALEAEGAGVGISPPPAPAAASEEHWLCKYSEMVQKPAPVKWLIENWVQEDAAMMIFGKSGCGKSFIALSMALSIATPKIEQWNGLRVKHGPVVYLAGEGYHGLCARVAGWGAHYGVSESEPDFYCSKKAVDLNTQQGLAEALKEIKSFNITPVLIVVDTLNRFMAGDENKAQDTRDMLNNLATLQRECGGAVMLVHHTGVAEDAQDRARGSSAWKGAMDIEMQATADGGSFVLLHQTKNKDADPADDILLDKVRVDVPGWLNEYGEQVRTLVMERCDAQEYVKKKEKKLPKLAQNAERCLRALEIAAGKTGVLREEDENGNAKCGFEVALEDWKTALKKDLEKKGCERVTIINSFKRGLEWLIDRNLIQQYENGKYGPGADSLENYKGESLETSTFVLRVREAIKKRTGGTGAGDAGSAPEVASKMRRDGVRLRLPLIPESPCNLYLGALVEVLTANGQWENDGAVPAAVGQGDVFAAFTEKLRDAKGGMEADALEQAAKRQESAALELLEENGYLVNVGRKVRIPTLDARRWIATHLRDVQEKAKKDAKEKARREADPGDAEMDELEELEESGELD